MKIQIVSDLHLEFGGNIINKLKKCKSDILILAGDTHTHKYVIPTIKDIHKLIKKPIIFIPGNHEYYGTNKKEMDEKFEEELTDDGIFYLNNKTCIIDDITFIGTTGWWDESNGIVTYIIMKNLNDFHYIKDIHQNNKGIYWGKQARLFLETTLKNVKTEKIVCITHHAPTVQSIPKLYRYDNLNAVYANKWEDLIFKYNPNLWIHGHTHTSFDYQLNNTNIVCNPRGYFNYEINDIFNPQFIKEI